MARCDRLRFFHLDPDYPHDSTRNLRESRTENNAQVDLIACILGPGQDVN